MFLVRLIISIVLSGLASLCVLQTAVASGLQQAEIEKFRLECWSSAAYDIELKFAPVRKLTRESRQPGQWSYEYASDENRYPAEGVRLPASGAVRVDLVTRLNQKDSGFGESYLWNVIVAPKVENWHFGAHWPIKKPISEYRRMADKRDSLINVAALSIHNGHPVHTQISPKDIDSAGTLNRSWESLFGEKIVSRLVYPASKGQQDYSLTF